MDKFNFRNITISGKVATGTSTLMNFLIAKLNWQHFSGGEFFRAYMKEHNMPLVEKSLTEDEVERSVDFGMRDRLQKESGLILEAWLSGFVAQQVPGVLKVLLVCKDDLRVDRFVNREGGSVEDAVQHIKKREEENIKKWTKLYSDKWQEWVVKPGTVSASEKIDFWDPKLYDLVIDTYKFSREETLGIVLYKLGYK